MLDMYLFADGFKYEPKAIIFTSSQGKAWTFYRSFINRETDVTTCKPIGKLEAIEIAKEHGYLQEDVEELINDINPAFIGLDEEIVK